MEDRVVRRVVESRNLGSFVVSTAVGLYLFRNWPFPAENDLLQRLLLQKPYLFYGIKYGFLAMLFSTPYIAFSILFSFTYIFVIRREEQIGARRLAPYLSPERRNELYLVVGELHHPKRPQPATSPRWLIVPERGLFTGIAIFGAVGSGKTTGCMYPFAEQVFAYRADEAERRVSGLVLEVKGDFCHKVRGILEKHDRADDYVEISLASPYRYNPLHNELEAYALAYGIASLLNNLFGRGKEPFGQQAYTNLVKFIILLHKVAYNYVTLFDVYECAISPVVLERKLKEAERRLGESDSVLVSEDNYLKHPRDLEPFEFRLNTDLGLYKAKSSAGLLAVLKDKNISFEILNESAEATVSQDKREQLEAVKRWFYNDWQRIEPKLRTSIVEGISVFLSLFDDNPKVKRVFCPPKECFDPQANADFKYGRPLPSFSWLIENGKVCAL